MSNVTWSSAAKQAFEQQNVAEARELLRSGEPTQGDAFVDFLHSTELQFRFRDFFLDSKDKLDQLITNYLISDDSGQLAIKGDLAAFKIDLEKLNDDQQAKFTQLTEEDQLTLTRTADELAETNIELFTDLFKEGEYPDQQWLMSRAGTTHAAFSESLLEIAESIDEHSANDQQFSLDWLQNTIQDNVRMASQELAMAIDGLALKEEQA